jgi:protocatechuate 3,4-dioxygenase beta subunit
MKINIRDSLDLSVKLLLLVILFFANNLNASQIASGTYEREVVYSCALTRPEIHFLQKPIRFNKGNNLTRRSKDIFSAQGKEIILEGYVLDQNCVPITNVSLQIWQTNSLGVNQNGIKAKNLRDNPEKLRSFDTHFANNGSNSSDNTGFYRFVLLEPCDECYKAVDLAVMHGRFQHLDTVVHFDSLESDCEREERRRVRRDSVYKYKSILNRDRNLTLKRELAILCDEDDITISRRDNILIRTSEARAKFIGTRNGKDVYRLDIVLSGDSRYRKY